MNQFLIFAAVLLGPSLIFGGILYLCITRKPRTKKDTFLGIDNMKQMIKNREKYPLLKPRKLSRKERRKNKTEEIFKELTQKKFNESKKTTPGI